MDLSLFVSRASDAKMRGKSFGVFFFASALDADMAGELIIDGEEIVAHAWLTPNKVQALHAAGEIKLLPPTLHTIHTVRDACATTDSKSAEETVQVLARADPQSFGFDTYFRAATSLVSVYPAFFAWWRRTKGF